MVDWNGIADQFVSDVVAFGPGIIGAILVIIIGYFISRGIKGLIVKILDKVGFEKFCERIKLTQAFQKIGFKSVSSLIGTLVFWALFIMFIGWGFGLVNIPQIVPILAAISLVLGRIIAAIVIVIIGIAVAFLVVEAIKKILSKFDLEKYFGYVDKTIEKTGIKVLDFFYYGLEAFIILFFVLGAFQVLNVEFLANIVGPILIYIPRFIVATGIVLIGLIIAEFCAGLVDVILKAINFDQLVKPVETVIRNEGLINKIIDIVIKVFVILLFIQLAFDILGIPILTEFINIVLLWLPAVVAAIAILVFAWWLGSWLGGKVDGWTKENEIPFGSVISACAKYLIIVIGIFIAMDQIGIEVMILNTILALAVIALIIPIAVALSFGFKDYGSDVGVGIKLKKIAKKGDIIETADVKGEIVDINNLSCTIKTDKGEIIVSNAALANAKVVKKGG